MTPPPPNYFLSNLEKESCFVISTLDNVQRLGSRHCPELQFGTCSTQWEIVRVKHVLTYWKYCLVQAMGSAWVERARGEELIHNVTVYALISILNTCLFGCIHNINKMWKTIYKQAKKKRASIPRSTSSTCSLAVNCPDNDLLFAYGLHLTLNELRTKELAG